MKKNVGGIDKALRVIAGIVLLGYAAGPLYGFDTGHNLWGLLGLVPLGTALLNFCPLYPILGLSTCKSS